MRNFSMKKFGTPMRAGPGVASETVGLSSVGEPSVLRVGLDSSTCFVGAPWPASRARRERLGVRVERARVGLRGLLVALGLCRPCLRSRPCSRARARGSRRRPGCCRTAARSGVGVGGLVGRGGRRSGVGRRRRDRAEVDDRLHGRGQAGDLDRLDRRAGRDVDGERQRLAGDERDGHAVQLGGSGHDEEAEHRGGGERDDQLPSSHLGDASPLSRSIGALLGPVRRFSFSPKASPHRIGWTIPAAIQERLNAACLAPFQQIFQE